MKQYTERLGTAPLGGLLIKMSMPGIASTITTSLYNVVNTLWVSRIGYGAIAALTIVMPFQILYYAIGGGTGIGVAALVSRRFGEKNVDAANRVAGQVFSVSIFWGVLFIILVAALTNLILSLLGATSDIMVFSGQYLVITSYGGPFVILASIVTSLMRGSGDAVKPMVIMIISTVINIVLDPLLIFGIGPFPELGVRGAALGTVIAQASGAILGLYYIVAGKTAFHIKFSYLRPDWSIIKDIYRVGAPTMVSQLMESLVFVLFNNVLKTFGSLIIAVVGIIMRISDFVFMPVMGVSNGLLPIVGYNYGAGDFKRVWKVVKLASVGIMAFLGVASIFMIIYAPQIIGVFSRDSEMLTAAIPAMRIMLSTMLFIGPTMMFITTFQGLSQGTKALFLSLLRQFIFFLPLLFLFRHIWGLTGVWLSMPASDILSFALTYVFIYAEYKKRRGGTVEMPEKVW